MEVQRLLGSDIQMQLDQCVRLPCSYEETERAMRLSLRWAERSQRAFGRQPGRAIFGIVQGGTERTFALFSAQALVEMTGTAIQSADWRSASRRRRCSTRSTSWSRICPRTSRRYLIGVGTPDDLLQSMRRGVDMFDCVMPTRAEGMDSSLPAGAVSTCATRASPTIRGRRSAVVVADGARLLARLSAPSGQVRRDPCDDGSDRNQPRLLSRSHVEHPTRDWRGAPGRLYRRSPTKLGGGEAEGG